MKVLQGAAGILTASLVVVGCTQSKTALIRMLDEVPGTNCATGG